MLRKNWKELAIADSMSRTWHDVSSEEFLAFIAVIIIKCCVVDMTRGNLPII